MALLYPWATKEYLLWNMDLAQLLLYHNKGIEIKSGKTKGGKSRKLSDMSSKEIAEVIEDMKKNGLVSSEDRQDLRDKYGSID